MMASAKMVRDCSSELSSDVRSLSVASSTEEQESTTTESEYTEEEKEYELEDLQILKTIGKWNDNLIKHYNYYNNGYYS